MSKHDIEGRDRELWVSGAGAWSADACPPDNLVGCCTYDYGLDVRECFYIGTTIREPEGYCRRSPGCPMSFELVCDAGSRATLAV